MGDLDIVAQQNNMAVACHNGTTVSHSNNTSVVHHKKVKTTVTEPVAPLWADELVLSSPISPMSSLSSGRC
jgi:hypothetical protein